MGEMENFYGKILGVPHPWIVREVKLDLVKERIDIWLIERPGTKWRCPICQEPAALYDHAQEDVWQHLDTCQCQTFVHDRLPRTNCSAHGVRQVPVPWASPSSGQTMAMESRVIDTLRECDISGASRLTGLSWGRVFRNQRLAVERGRARKGWRVPEFLGVDEKAFAKRHHYVTLVYDLKAKTVEHVVDDRGRESLADYYVQYHPEDLEKIQAVAMDMWPPFFAATQAYVPKAEEKIVFDHFHVTRYLTKAVDQVRRKEHVMLRRQNDHRLKGTKYLWLANAEHIPLHRQEEFQALRNADLKTGRAWAIKESFRHFWEVVDAAAAADFFRQWYFWASHSRLAPMIAAAKTIRAHLANVLTFFKHRITNATAEGFNSKIQMVKEMACGFRNREHDKIAIYFHCGGLDLYPHPVAG